MMTNKTHTPYEAYLENQRRLNEQKSTLPGLIAWIKANTPDYKIPNYQDSYCKAFNGDEYEGGV
jgi:hypothetical protein